MLRLPYLLVVLLIALGSTAQTKPVFRSQSFVGLLEGENDANVTIQTINGLGYHNWFGGIGAGIDWAGGRSIPVFVSVNKFIASNKHPLFFSGDIGLNFPWLKSDVMYIRDPGDYYPGLYWGAGAGWRFGMKKNDNAVLVNFGYNYKQYRNSYETPQQCLVPPCPVDKTTYDYRLRRLALRVGWMF